MKKIEYNFESDLNEKTSELLEKIIEYFLEEEMTKSAEDE